MRSTFITNLYSSYLVVSARVMLSQVFENESESPTSRAKYVFPLPANAAICAFELQHADGRVMTGVAKLKEKSEAAETFMVRWIPKILRD